MSALEDILTGALGKALGGDEEKKDKSDLVQLLIPVVISLFGNGGLQKILDAMRKKGLSAEADSWVGSGENLPISGEQAKEVVGESQVESIAGKLGIPEGQAAELIADALPKLVDKTAPEGQEPASDDVGKILEALKG